MYKNHTRVLEKNDCKTFTRDRIASAAMVNTSGWHGNNGLLDVGFDCHYCVHHRHDQFMQGSAYINGIESCWNFAKVASISLLTCPEPPFCCTQKNVDFASAILTDQNLYKVPLKELYQHLLNRLLIEPHRGINAKLPLLVAGESEAGGATVVKLAATDSPTGEGSTIGAPGLNDSVRNGKR